MVEEIPFVSDDKVFEKIKEIELFKLNQFLKTTQNEEKGTKE